jgi:DNA recombination protein RmuC
MVDLAEKEPAMVAVGIGLLLLATGVTAWIAVAAVRRNLEARMGEAGAELRRVADAAAWRDRGADDLRREVSSFRESLERMRTREEERHHREEQAWAVLQRVSAVLAGSQQAGRAGENVLREALGQLPPSMLVRDFRVNGRVVEFGLVLPDGRRLPVDSKWPAERELLLLAEASDPVDRERLARIVERTVAERAREVAGYLDASVTAPIAVAAVPDAAYAVLRRAHADAYRQGVVVIPYSMALPVLLFLHGIVSRFGAVGDMQACLADLAAVLDGVESTLENKVTRASTMLLNGAEELRGQMGKARSILSRARQAEGAAEGRELASDAGEVPEVRLAGVPR